MRSRVLKEKVGSSSFGNMNRGPHEVGKVKTANRLKPKPNGRGLFSSSIRGTSNKRESTSCSLKPPVKSSLRRNDAESIMDACKCVECNSLL